MERSTHPDHQGSIIAVAGSGGASVATDTYDEYGIPGAANAGRFQYTGQAWLAELGLYYYKARMYSPTLGRFMQVDPIGYADQYNLYAYVRNDPFNRADPSGEAGPREVADALQVIVTDPDTYVAAFEAFTGYVLMNVGADGLAGSGALEVGTGGLATPAAGAAAGVSVATMATGAGLAVDSARRLGGVLQRATDPNSQDRQRVREQRERRNERREFRSRQGPNGNGQNPSGTSPRAEGRAQGNRGPSGQRPRGPDRRFNRERNRGIDEEHNMKPPGQQSQ